MNQVPSAPPQVIPRPPTSAPGSPPPWSDLPASERSGFTVDVVRRRVANPVALDRRPEAARESAVLGALFEEDGEARVVLTRRASTLRSHRNEVSFPGGRVEAGETLAQAALRETWEEVAIEPATVEIIATLSPLQTFSSRALIQPFVGLLPGRPVLRPSPAEVERAFDASLAELLAPGVHRSERWGIGGEMREMHFFELPGDIVWGATGRLLFELLVRATGTATTERLDTRPVP